jgi:hypothetical protein
MAEEYRVLNGPNKDLHDKLINGLETPCQKNRQ